MHRDRTASLIALLLLYGMLFPQQPKPRRIALLNGVAHTGDGRVIAGSAVILDGERISYVGPAAGAATAGYDTIIDVSGKHVYPALINANSVLGLHDAEAVRATRDFADVGTLNPHVRALIAYNTDNVVIPTIRSNGVLYTQATPRGGLVCGSSSVMKLEGWNWEDAVLQADDGIHLNYPKMVSRKLGEPEEKIIGNAIKAYENDILLLDRFMADAKAYCGGPVPQEKDLRFGAMRKVLNGEARLYIRADKAKDILSALGFVSRHGIRHAVIVGGKESWLVTRELRKHRVPVILNRVNDLPDQPDDDIDIVYRLPYLLQRDSVLFCIQMEGDMEAMHGRNLPFNAGVAVAFGLTKEQALAAITSNVAKILGVDDRIGTLAPGKLASVVVSEGDILDIRSNSVIFAFLSGKRVMLENRQTRLYERYRNKYGIR